MMTDRQVVRQCNTEVMKMAMLKHEETFRQQARDELGRKQILERGVTDGIHSQYSRCTSACVSARGGDMVWPVAPRGDLGYLSAVKAVNELHRLYRIQRQLMSDLTRDEPVATRRRSKQPRRALDLQLPADEYIVSADEDDEAAGAELELTLAVGGRSPAARRKQNSSRRRQELQHGSPGGGSDDCSGVSLLSSSPSSAGYYSDDGPAAVFHAPPAPPCQRAMAFDLGDGMMRQQAPWLMQCQQYLSLRMT